MNGIETDDGKVLGIILAVLFAATLWRLVRTNRTNGCLLFLAWLGVLAQELYDVVSAGAGQQRIQIGSVGIGLYIGGVAAAVGLVATGIDTKQWWAYHEGQMSRSDCPSWLTWVAFTVSVLALAGASFGGYQDARHVRLTSGLSGTQNTSHLGRGGDTRASNNTGTAGTSNNTNTGNSGALNNTGTSKTGNSAPITPPTTAPSSPPPTSNTSSSAASSVSCAGDMDCCPQSKIPCTPPVVMYAAGQTGTLWDGAYGAPLARITASAPTFSGTDANCCRPHFGSFATFTVTVTDVAAAATNDDIGPSEFDFYVQLANGQKYGPALVADIQRGNSVEAATGMGVTLGWNRTGGSIELYPGQSTTGTVVVDMPQGGGQLYYAGAGRIDGAWSF